MDEPRLDLSALDPYADRRRFERAVAAITAGVQAPPDRLAPAALLLGDLLLGDIVRWGRFGLAAAAAVALAAWTPSLLSSGSARGGAAPVDAVQLVASWAQSGAIPSDASLFQLDGADDAR